MAVGPGALTVALNMDHGTGTKLMGDKSTAIACGGQHTDLVSTLLVMWAQI